MVNRVTARAVYFAAVDLLDKAFAAVELAGQRVEVHPWPPVTATGPAAWVELVAAGRGATVATNVATVRLVVVPPTLETDQLEQARLDVLDALDAVRLVGGWRAQIQQTVELGGVTRDAVFVETVVDYPSTC